MRSAAASALRVTFAPIIWLVPMRAARPAITDRRLTNTRDKPPPRGSEARLRQRQKIAAVMPHGL
jgi:hypothetical protein